MLDGFREDDLLPLRVMIIDISVSYIVKNRVALGYCQSLGSQRLFCYGTIIIQEKQEQSPFLKSNC